MKWTPRPQKSSPGELKSPAIQLGKITRTERPDTDENSAGGPEPEIGEIEFAKFTEKEDSPLFDFHIGNSEAEEFGGTDLFKARRRYRKEMISVLFHQSPFLQ